MIRIAAVGDVHVDKDVVGRYRPALEELPDQADALLIAGDLTRHGTVEEAECFATEFGGLAVPVVVVLGNHDHQSDQQEGLTKVLTDAGITVLEGDATVLELNGHRLGIAGTKGFGGGFNGACASNFGEREMKDFVGTSERYAAALRAALRSVEECDALVALTHYAPVPETLAGEPPEIFAFLGCYQLGQAIDEAPTTLALHGHAHHGSERGRTPGGVPVRNVAHPVIKQAYNVYQLLTDTVDTRDTALANA
ncbi:metallophosphoesterase family protein [Actinoplanes siamensis]|uniref:Metallophosphoesterase n=1 Tax=Actinoplanes siamensis TaxID=1223317 RepID=A0A919TMR6_9ACTN|nr:metallophosphoesterase [Actinoplanes siamensis]GIF08631.1 metallophosphoesterase [Actinoplanes siamensis]